MRAYSLDLRQKIVEAYDRRMGSQRQIAETFGVSQSFVEKLLRRRRTRGVIGRLPRGGGRRCILDQQGQQQLHELVSQQPDATLEELRQALYEGKEVVMCVATVSTELRRLGFVRKKRASTPQKETAPGFNKPGSLSERTYQG
jgi:transposase